MNHYTRWLRHVAVNSANNRCHTPPSATCRLQSTRRPTVQVEGHEPPHETKQQSLQETRGDSLRSPSAIADHTDRAVSKVWWMPDAA
jgi:hypothetical protein